MVVAACAALAFGFFPTIGLGSTRDRDAVMRQVASTLATEHQTDVYAGYWTAMPLQYVAGDRLVVATAGGVQRFPDAQTAVEQAPSPVYVGSDHDGTTAAFRAALDRAHLPYRARKFAFLTVFDGLPGSADPAVLGL
jgi:hypothetical protein